MVDFSKKEGCGDLHRDFTFFFIVITVPSLLDCRCTAHATILQDIRYICIKLLV